MILLDLIEEMVLNRTEQKKEIHVGDPKNLE